MNERNPRSKLRQMKRRYFAATALVYLVIFFIAYLVCEMLFMIFEAGPYTELAVLLMVMVIDGVLTDYIINTRMKNRWRREAPDILDDFKAPEPAYIPDGPVVTEPSDQEKPAERKRLRRTQYKELKEEFQSENAAKQAQEPSPAKTSEQSGLSRLFHRKKEKASSSDPPAGAAQIKKEKKDSVPASGKSKDVMNAADFNTAETDSGHHAAEALSSNAASEKKQSRRARMHFETLNQPAADSGSKSDSSVDTPESDTSFKSAVREVRTESMNRPRRTPESPRKSRMTEASKPSASSSWAASLDDMETISITDAVGRIEQAETKNDESRNHQSGKRAKTRNQRRTSKR